MLIPSAILAPRAAPAGGTYLDATLASTVFQLDATVAASYGGTGQTWSNLTASPADGAGQTAYDFYLGKTSSSEASDPAFNGTPGSSAAYWSTTGSQGFTLKGANTTFLNTLHRTTGGQDFWFALAFFMNTSTSNQTLFDTSNNFSGPGINININSTNVLRFGQEGAASASTTSTTALTDATINLCIFSYSHSGASVKYWVNSRTATDTNTLTFSTTTGNAAAVPALLELPSGSSSLQSGGRLYGVAMGNEFLTDTKAGAIATYYNALHGRTYA